VNRVENDQLVTGRGSGTKKLNFRHSGREVKEREASKDQLVARGKIFATEGKRLSKGEKEKRQK